jgi:hypothetical protein
LKLGSAAGEELVGEFGLDEHEKAFNVGSQHTEAGKKVLFSL